MFRSVGSGLAGLHLRSKLMGELSALSHSWLTLGGAAPPESARPQMSKNTENKGQGNAAHLNIPAAYDHFFFFSVYFNGNGQNKSMN